MSKSLTKVKVGIATVAASLAVISTAGTASASTGSIYANGNCGAVGNVYADRAGTVYLYDNYGHMASKYMYASGALQVIRLNFGWFPKGRWVTVTLKQGSTVLSSRIITTTGGPC